MKHLRSSHLKLYKKVIENKGTLKKVQENTIQNFFLKTSSKVTFKTMSKRDKKMELGRKLALLACESYIPFQTLTSIGFKRFLMSSGFEVSKIPSERALLETCLEDVYTTCLTTVKQFISNNCPAVCCISTDGWTDSHLGLSYINYNLIFHHKGDLKTILLEVAPYNEKKTGVNLKEDLKRVMKEFGISEKFVYLVSDNARNNKAAFKEAQNDSEMRIIARIPCIAHNIHNLVYTDIFNSNQYHNKDLKTLIKKLISIHHRVYFKKAKIADVIKSRYSEEIWKKIIDHYDTFSDFNSDLENEINTDFEATESCKVTTFRKNNTTRWNSTLAMFRSFLPLRTPINQILCEAGSFDLLVSDEEEKVIRELIGILEIFEVAVNVCQVINLLCKRYLKPF